MEQIRCLLLIGDNRKKLTVNGTTYEDLRNAIKSDANLKGLVDVDCDLLQLYDNDFEEFIDCDDQLELEDKCKIKVLKLRKTVIPPISAAASSSAPVPVSVHISTPQTPPLCLTQPVSPSISSPPTPPPIPMPVTVIYNDIPSSSSGGNQAEHMYITRSVTLGKSTMVDSQMDILMNYTLPEFPKTVSMALEQKKPIIPNLKKEIVHSLFLDILKYTLYPPRQFYAKVARALLEKYPHVADEVGSGIGSWISCLKCKFKNERRKRDSEDVLHHRQKYSAKRKKRRQSRELSRNINDLFDLQIEELIECSDNKLPADVQHEINKVISMGGNNSTSDEQHSFNSNSADHSASPQQQMSTAIPLVYSLPKFPADVQIALDERKSLTTRERKGLIETVFQDMLRYTMYPPKHFYSRVCQALISEYPYLADVVGSGYESWLHAIRFKFKNERRKRDSDDIKLCREKYTGKKLKRASMSSNVESTEKIHWKGPMLGAVHQNEEERCSLVGYQKWLNEEAQKIWQNPNEIRDKMNATFLQRQSFIRNHDISHVLEAYPLMKFEEEFLNDFMRLTGKDIRKCLTDGLSTHANVLLGCVTDEKEKVFRLTKDLTNLEEKKNIISAGAILSIIRAFREDQTMLFSHAKPESGVPTVTFKGEDLYRCSDLELYIGDIKVLKSESLVMALCCVFASYWIFNLQYHKKLVCTLSFMEHAFLNLGTSTPRPRVIRLLNKLYGAS